MKVRQSASQFTARFGPLLEAAPDAMLVVNDDGRIVAANAQAHALFGHEAGELIGQSIEMLVPERYRERHARQRQVYGNHPHARPMGAGLELYGLRKSGTEFPVEISLSPLATDDGVLYTSAVRDVTDRKRLEDDIRRKNQALEEQNRRVEEASRLKSAFLANMSHELRTPLNSIIGFAEMMHDGTLGPIADNHREYLADILMSARHLLDLINDVLDLSKVESGAMDFFPEALDVASVVGDVCDMLRATAAAKRLRVAQSVDPAVATVIADPGKLRQVLSNFLSNAVKFTPEGGSIDIRVRPDGDAHFRIEVEDTGIGIRKDEIGRLFEEFRQLDSGDARKHQGTGLGLALTRRLVEAQGGHVGVRSAVGRGSLFYAVLPRSTAPASVPALRAPSPAAPLAGARVTVVDDDSSALRLLETALRMRGFRPTCTNDPHLALAAAVEYPPDLLVLDLLMAPLSGEEFLRRFRALPQTRGTRVIVWTVKDLSPLEREELLAFAQAIVPKRVDALSGLLECIAAYAAPGDDDTARS